MDDSFRLHLATKPHKWDGKAVSGLHKSGARADEYRPMFPVKGTAEVPNLRLKRLGGARVEARPQAILHLNEAMYTQQHGIKTMHKPKSVTHYLYIYVLSTQLPWQHSPVVAHSDGVELH